MAKRAFQCILVVRKGALRQSANVSANRMLNNLFVTKSQDPHFGTVKVFKGDSLGSFTIEKTIDFGPFQQVALYLENTTSNSTQLQIDQYNLISNRAHDIIEEISRKYTQEYNSALLNEYDLEFISLKEDSIEWELSFLRKGGFEYCVVEYTEMMLKAIYFDA